MIVAITMVKNEEDIIGHNIAHLLAEGVDHIIVADNLSADGTRDILDGFAESHPVTVVDDPVVGYLQSEKMTLLAHQAGRMGADWIVPFDADEMVYSPHGTLKEVLTAAPQPVQWIVAYEHVPQDDDDVNEANPMRRIVHRRPEPKPFMKVAFRYDPSICIWQGNHQVDHPGETNRGLLEIREFQYRSLDQTRRKVRNGKVAYEATDLAASEGAHWREMGAMGDDELELWWKAYQAQPVVLDPPPVRA